MIKKLFVFYLLLLFHAPLLAQIKTTTTPFWVDKIAFAPGNITAEKVSGGQAYLLVDHQYNIETEEIYVHYSYQILSETGIQNGSVIEVTFDPAYESLSFIGIDVYRGDGKTNQLNLDNFQVIQKEANAERFIYDGQKTAILHLSDIRMGDVIDYKFILKGRNPAFKGKFYASFYLNFQEPVGRNYKKIRVPAQRTLHIKSFETSIAPEVEEGKYKTYRWDFKNTEGILYDLYTPSWFDPYARVQISEYESWEEISKWALPLYTPQKSDLREVKRKAAQIKQENKTKEDQITAAINFVQDEIRYLGFESGLNSYVPHSPSSVIEQRFGDCKDKSFLLAELLNALGIEAYPALVSSGKGELLPKQLPAPEVFDHCIVKAVVDRETYWYDPTISNQGGDYASTFIPNYKYALVIKEGTSSLETIKAVSYSKIESRETYTIKDYDQPVLLHVTTIYKGQEADFQRQFFMRNSLPQIRKNYLNYYTETYPQIKVAKELTYDDDPDINIFTTYEEYEIPDFWKPVEGSNENVVKCEVYPQMVIDAITDPGHVDRNEPLFLNYPKDIDQIIEFYFPDEWSLQNTSNRVEAPGIIYTDFVTFFGKKVTLNYTLKTLKDHLKPEEIKDYYEKVSKIKPQLGYVLTHNKDLAQASNSPSSNWLLVVLSLVMLTISLFLARKVYFHYDPFSPNKRIAYDQIGGWLVLAGIGITLSPFLILFNIFSQDYFNQGLWINITTSSSPNYSPILAISLALELLINIVFLVFSSLLAILFYKRRSSFPRLVIIYYVVSFLFLTVDALVVGSLNILPDSVLFDSYKAVARSFLTMVIWVPYFLISERVKETFVNTVKDYEEEPIVKEEIANA